MPPPVKIVIDSSTDRIRSTWVALVVAPNEKPRLIYGTGWHIRPGDVERWGIRKALRRVNTRYGGQQPILVHTDNLSIVETYGTSHVQYKWLSREERLMIHIHKAARALRLSMPKVCGCCGEALTAKSAAEISQA